MTDQIMSDDDIEYKHAALMELAKDSLEEFMPELPPSLWSDLLGWAFNQAEFYDIVDHWIDDWNYEHTDPSV